MQTKSIILKNVRHNEERGDEITCKITVKYTMMVWR